VPARIVLPRAAFNVDHHALRPPVCAGQDDPSTFGEFMAVRRPSTTSTVASATPATFADLGVPARLVRALAAGGITAPLPIQAATLPDALAGRDVLGRAQTGSGKTYAFALPMLARLAASTSVRRPRRPRALILAPTRELATQIEAAIAPLARELSLRTLTVFGGVRPAPQISALRGEVDIVVACPGRLIDHVDAGHVVLDAIEITVLDEADHMADLGFLPAVRHLIEKTPRASQRLLFSATLDAGVDVLVRRFLTDPVKHSVDSSLSPVTTMSHHMLHVRQDDRLPVLVDLTAAPGRSLVFTRTKRGAKTLTRRLNAAGVPAVELHGNLAQAARDRNLQAFSTGSATTLVATDIAARGIHVDDIRLVIHADPPVEHKAYLHRSGRTARAGAHGTVVTLMTDDQVHDVRDLSRKAGIVATTTRLRPGDPILARLAPGVRTFVAAPMGETAPLYEPAAVPQPRNRPRRRGMKSPASASSPAAPAEAAGRSRPNRAGAPGVPASAATKSAAVFSARAKGGTRRGGR
jgi:superfamily II DNA/RNA helicase